MRKPRLWTLYEQQDGKWVQLSRVGFAKQTAIRVYQDSLLAPYLRGIDGEIVKGIRELRPMKQD